MTQSDRATANPLSSVPDLTWWQKFARWSLGASKIDPDFPRRPNADEITKEYTPERVIRLARYIAGKRFTEDNPEQYDEDVAECVALIYDRIDKYNKNLVKINENYPFYYWLLFDVRTALRDLRNRGKDLFVQFSTLESSGKPDFDQDDPLPQQQLQIDVREALDNLTVQQKQVVLLYYMEQKTQPEIAYELGVTQPAVSQILERAKARLEYFLTPSGQTPRRSYDRGGRRGKNAAPGETPSTPEAGRLPSGAGGTES